MQPDRYTWEPLSVAEAVEIFAAAPFRWWISGGHALELHAGETWRLHDDLDIGIRRDQTPLVYGWLSDWDLHIASAGRLSDSASTSPSGGGDTPIAHCL